MASPAGRGHPAGTGPDIATTIQLSAILLAYLFFFCSNGGMVDTSTAETPSTASPSTDERETEVLSGLTKLAEDLARGFHALALAALAAGDLDRAGTAETRFSSLFLGIRRAIARKARLRQQREQARREAEARRKARQDETDGRRQAAAQGVAAAIAVAPGTDAEAQERLTAELWEKLTEDERIDVDLADTALPIEALIASLCRALGLPPHGTPPAGGPAGAAKSGADNAGAGPKGQASGSTRRRAASSHDRTIPAEEFGRSEGERGIHIAATGEIFIQDREHAPALSGDDRPPPSTGPPAPVPPPDPALPQNRHG
ncbi:hypothetical protein QFZ27_006479 [Inquilinus ginsengisoli]|uniref:hypothetical protein n=1 Tax=Inquilinus ginsengisoli TaxID=363840 RepID=UPI003D229B16